MKHVVIEWMDGRVEEFDVSDAGYSPNGFYWLTTENQPDIGDREIHNFPLSNIRDIRTKR